MEKIKNHCVILLSGFFVERENNRDLHVRVHISTTLFTWPKLPLRNRLHCSSFKFPLRGAHRISVSNIAIRIYDKVYQYLAGNPSTAHFKRILRPGLKPSYWLLIEFRNVEDLDTFAQAAYLSLRNGNGTSVNSESLRGWRLQFLNERGVGDNLRDIGLHRRRKICRFWGGLVRFNRLGFVWLHFRHFHQLDGGSIINHFFDIGRGFIFTDPSQPAMKSERNQYTNNEVAAHFSRRLSLLSRTAHDGFYGDLFNSSFSYFVQCENSGPETRLVVTGN